jgi:WD40 repeat protein
MTNQQTMKYILLLLFTTFSLFLFGQQPTLMLQKGHTAPITDMAISEDGRLIVSASYDGTIRLWDALSKKELRVFYTQSMGQIKIALKGQTLAAAMPDGNLKLWKIENGQLLKNYTFTENPITDLDFNLAKAEILLGFADGKIMMLNYENDKRSEVIQAHSDWINTLGFSADGLHFLTAAADGLVLWNTKKMEKKQGLLGTSVSSANFSADGNYLVSGGQDGIVKVFKTEDGGYISALEGNEKRLIFATITPDNGTIISVDLYGKTTVWNAQTQDTIQVFNIGTGVNAVKLHPDGRTLVTGFRQNVRLWRTETGKQITDFKGLIDDWEAKYVNSVKFSIDNQEIISIGDKAIRFWGEISGDKIDVAENIEQLILHPNGRNLATLEKNGKIVLWDAISKDTVRVFEGESSHIVFTENGRLLLGYLGNKLLIWQTATGKLLDYVKIGNDDIFKLAIHPDGSTIAISTTSGKIHIYDYRTGTFLAECETQKHQFFALTFTKDGTQIIGGTEDGYLVIWDVATGKFVMKIKAHEGMVSTLVVDNQYFISGDVNGDIEIWNHYLEPIGQLKGHTKMVMDMDRKGDFLVSCAADNTILLWDLKTRQSLAQFYAFNDDWVIISPEGLFDGSSNSLSKMHYVIGLEPLELSQLKERYFEPGLLAKLLKISIEPLRDVSKFDAVPLYPIAELEWKDKDNLILKIKLNERNGGIGKVSLFINKKELLEDINPKRKKEIEIKLADFQRFLKNDNDDFFSVKTYNEVGWLSSKPERIRYVPTANARGTETDGKITIQLGKKYEPKMYAIIVGTSDYRGEKMDLSYADKDATDMAEGLKGVGEALFGAENVEVNLLISNGKMPSTKTNIQQAFANIATAAKPEDVVIIYFSGHGVTYGATEAQFYYLTKDVASADIEDATIRQNFTIATNELTEMLKSIPAQKQVLIIDACSSGSLVNDVLSQTRGLSSSQRRALDRMKDRTGMFILAGSAANKVSYEASQFGQGLLTYSLLLGMNGSALREGKYVDVMQLFQFAADKVPEFAAFIGGVQRPVIATPAGSNSFDIGQLTADVRIPMMEVKPLFVRSNFQEETNFDDYLELGDALDNRLTDISSEGKTASILFVNVKKYPNGYSIKGRYIVEGEDITVKVNLFKGETAIKNFTVNGSIRDVNGLVDLILKEVE